MKKAKEDCQGSFVELKTFGDLVETSPAQFCVDLLEVKDQTVNCIHALSQVMNFFIHDGEMNDHNDIKAVNSWFVSRYGRGHIYEEVCK